MKQIRDEILEFFISKKDMNIKKFFISPCFACVHLGYDSDGDEYQSWSWPICYMEDKYRSLEYFVENKKEFPVCEAPKLCHRKNLFKPTRFSRSIYSFDDFDGIGYAVWGMLEDIDYDAPSIAGSVAGFHRRMSEVRL